MTVKLDGPRLPPASGTARQLVVLLHGYGADGNDLIGLAPHWQGLLPDAAFVAPNAPEPVPGSFGFQWFALNRYDPEAMRRDPVLAGQVFAAMRDAVAKAAPALNAFIDDEVARLNLKGQPLALVGFSQGTMMSLYAGPRRSDITAIVGYSGSLIAGESLPKEAKCKPPILLIHGDSDPVVPPERLQAALGPLGAAGFTVESHLVPGLGHGIDPTGLERGGRFLRDAFHGDI